MNNQNINSGDGLIRTNIRRRQITYFLVSEEDINSLRSKTSLSEIFMLITSLAWGAYVSVHITKSVSVKIQEQTLSVLSTLQWVFVIAGIIFLGLTLYFMFLYNSSIKRIKSSGEVEKVDKAKMEDSKKISLMVSSPPSFRVIEATYGTAVKSIDATVRLNGLINNGRLFALANNELAGDPDVGTVKHLTIKYEHNGAIITKQYKEGQQIELP